MPISDKKKCQTLINVTALQAQIMTASAEVLAGVKAAYLAASPDPTGTPLDGHVGEVGQWISDVQALMSDPIVAIVIAAYVPTHSGKALEV